jgi:hypothetical protein
MCKWADENKKRCANKKDVRMCKCADAANNVID